MTDVIVVLWICRVMRELSGHLPDLPAQTGPPTGQQGEPRFDAPAPQQGTATDEMLRLQEISTLLISEGNTAALYERILDGAIGLMSADMGSMQMLDRERGALKLICSRGFHPESAAFWQWVRLDSDCTCGLALSSGARVIVTDVEICPVMVGTADLDSYRRSGIRAVQSTPLVSRSGELLGMISTHWREPHQSTDRALRALDILARQGADLIERSHAEAALRRSEERYQRLACIVESSEDAIISTDLSGIISTWNKGAERLYGYTAAEVIGKSVTTLIPPEWCDAEVAILARVRHGERIETYDAVRRHKDGSRVDILLTVSPLKNAAGDVVGTSKIARDITDRKRLERDVQLLSREVDHRAKNLLAVVQAIVNLSNADTTSDLKVVLAGRIRALARAHTRLAEARWTGVDLGGLVRQELAPYCSEQALDANVDGPPVQLTPERAQPFALLFHELTTNAAKYGALSVRAGHVRVDWVHGDDGRLLLHWIERDGPSIKPPDKRGFGMQVIDEVVRRQLAGELRFDWGPGGLTCSFDLPDVSNAAQSPQLRETMSPAD